MASSIIPSPTLKQVGSFSSTSQLTVTIPSNGRGLFICVGSSAARLSMYMYTSGSATTAATTPVLNDSSNTLTNTSGTSNIVFTRSGTGTISVFMMEMPT